MKKIGMIIAGGVGERMGANVPKQYVKVYNKPVIVYTMEAFQNHPDIDAITIVCQQAWEEDILAYAKTFGITKLEHIYYGGSTGQESIRNGVFGLENDYSPEDIILIHDAIRPLVSKEVLDDCIRVTVEKGNAIVCLPCVTSMLTTEDGGKSSDIYYDRDKLLETQTPQAFDLKTLGEAHREALEKGITDATASCVLMTRLGKKVYVSKGEERNIKLTTPEDMDMFMTLLRQQEKDVWKRDTGLDITVIAADELNEVFKHDYRQYLVGNLKKEQELPFVYDTNCEIGISDYKEAFVEKAHYHTLVTEMNYLISGHAKIFNLDTNETIEVEAGGFYTFPPYQKHKVELSAGSKVIFIKNLSVNDKVSIDE